MNRRIYVGLILAACISCGPITRWATEYPAEHRPAVRVTNTCGQKSFRGSGVVVGRHTVLTAAHVVECTDGEPRITVELFPGMHEEHPPSPKLRATITTTTPTDGPDLALLEVKETLPRQPVRVAEPEVDTIVCLSATVPQREFSCGAVRKIAGPIFQYSALGHPGSSGSGVYDTRGRLVGIQTNGAECPGLGECGGWGTVLDRYRWIVEAAK